MAMDATPNAIWRLRSGERTQPGGPPRRRARLRRHSPPSTFGQRLCLFSPLRRRTAGYRSPVRRKTRHPLAGYGAIRMGLNTALMRLATVPAASAAPRRPCVLRLVSPPPRPALRTQQAQEVLRAEGEMRFRGTPADPFIPQGLSVIERICGAGSGGGLPVLRDARHEPRQTVR